MNEIWEVTINGEVTQRSVSSEDRDRFLQDYPGAVLVPSGGSNTVNSPNFNYENFQAGFKSDSQGGNTGNIILPGTGKVREGKKELTFFDKSWFGSKFNQASSTGESMDLWMEQSNVTMETVRAFVDAEYENAANYVESERMKTFTAKYEKGGSSWSSFFGAVTDDLTILPELFVSSLGTQIGTFWDSDAAKAAGGTMFAAGATYGYKTGGGGRASLVKAGAMGLYSTMAGVTASMETSLTFAELIREELDLKNLEFNDVNVKALLEGPEGNSIRNKAVGRGLAIGFIEGVTGFVAGGATTTILRTGPRIGTKFLAGTGGVVVEGIGGGIGEVAGMTAADQDYDIAEIGFEAITGTVSAPATVGYSLLTHKDATYVLNKEPVSFQKMKHFISTATDMQIATANIKMTNDVTGLSNIANEKQQNAIIDSQIDAKVSDITDRQNLVALEKQRRILKRNKKADKINHIPGLDEKLTVVEGKIKSLIDKYEGAVDVDKLGWGQTDIAKSKEKSRGEQSI